MAVDRYGVVVGAVDHFERDAKDNFGHWYHGKLYVRATDGLYQCAIDVDTPLDPTTGLATVSHPGVFYLVAPELADTDLGPVATLPDGFTQLAPTPTSGAVDYVRTPALARLGEAAWLPNSGDNALNVLEGELAAATRVWTFGSHYSTGLGVHDVHMNQGDPPGPFQHLDAIWQDGGIVIRRPTGALVGWLVRFRTQSLHTDDRGHPIPRS